jgi:hypothetical protein
VAPYRPPRAIPRVGLTELAATLLGGRVAQRAVDASVERLLRREAESSRGRVVDPQVGPEHGRLIGDGADAVTDAVRTERAGGAAPWPPPQKLYNTSSRLAPPERPVRRG